MIYHLKDKLPQLRENWYKYAHMWQRIQIPAHTILLSEGEVSRQAFYIEKGCLRAWFNNKGKDVTFQFFFENESVSSIESFRKNKPSLFTIESVEPTTVFRIFKKDFEKIVKEIPEVREYLMNLVLDRQINYAYHFLSFIKYNPMERYINLLNERPEIIRRIPQHYIASYLGITPVSLSRIRKRLSRYPETINISE